jgi:hypothetical protein
VVSLQSDADVNREPTKTGPNPPVENPGHSDIFERLSAHNEADLVGLVAYGIYQRQKREWIAAFYQAHGRFPSQDERQAYAFSYRDGGLSSLRTSAEGTLAAFGERLIEEQIETLRANALDVQTQALLAGIDAKMVRLESYKHHIFGHVLGFGCLVLLVAFVSVLVRFEPTVEGAYHNLFALETKSQPNIEQSEQPAPPVPRPAPRRGR